MAGKGMRILEQAPLLSICLAFAMGILWFQERRDVMWAKMLERGEVVSKLRIEQCHAVQAESTEALKAVAEALTVHAVAFNEVSVRLETSANRINFE